MYRSAKYIIYYITGWEAVKHEVKISHDLETTPLQIMTDSTAGSRVQSAVYLYTAEGDSAGAIYFYFYTPPQYTIGECREYFDFHSTLPSEVKKVWQISKHPGPRITLQCNGVTVLDALLSNSYCKKPNWGQYWSRPVKQIMFGSVDKTSDKYRAAAPDKNHHVQNHLFIITLHIIILSVLLLT